MFLPFHDENPTVRPPIFTVTIILVNVAVLLYMGSLGRDPRQGDYPLRQFIYKNGFIPARVRQLTDQRPIEVDLYPRVPGWIAPNGRPQKLRLEPNPGQILGTAFTAMFMHAGWLHLIMNMWFFWIFGNNIEDRLGHVTFLSFYLVGGLIATACHWAMIRGPGLGEPVIGASGAVAVTLGAYAVFYPLARVKTLVFIIIFFTIIEIPAWIVLGFWFIAQLMSGLEALNPRIGTNVAWWAHIGGFMAGVVLMPLLAAGTPDPKERLAEQQRASNPSPPQPANWM